MLSGWICRICPVGIRHSTWTPSSYHGPFFGNSIKSSSRRVSCSAPYDECNISCWASSSLFHVQYRTQAPFGFCISRCRRNLQSILNTSAMQFCQEQVKIGTRIVHYVKRFDLSRPGTYWQFAPSSLASCKMQKMLFHQGDLAANHRHWRHTLACCLAKFAGLFEFF